MKGGTILSKTVKKKDLGVTMNANMKVSEQCRIAASKGNHGSWNDSEKYNIYKEKSLILPLYKAISLSACVYLYKFLLYSWQP